MNVKNRTLFIADNLGIMRGIDSETIDLIYLDPPFNTKKTYKAPIGSPAEGAKFKDIWTDEDVKHEWHGEVAETHEELYQIIQASEAVYDKSMKLYLMAMAVRLFEMKRILKSTGSIYLHCDPTASHYLKLVMDSLFGKNNFRAEIVWKRHNAHNDKVFGSIHEIIFCYSQQKIEISDKTRLPIDKKSLTGYNYSDCHENKHGKYCTGDLTAPKPSTGEAGKLWKGIDPENRQWSPPRTGEYAKYIEKHFIPNYRDVDSPHKRLDLLDNANLLHWSGSDTPSLKRYQKAKKGNLPQSLWTDIKPVRKPEKTGWPTQKPLALLKRIIKASSNENDVVLDPFCGCATACVAAEQLQRQWIGIDISPSAEDITKLRLLEEVQPEQPELWHDINANVIVTSDPPIRTDDTQTAVQRRLPAYQTHKHELYGKQEGYCLGCELHYRFKDLTVDHEIPQSKGGTDHIENLQLLCFHCNSIKGDRPMGYLKQRLQEQRENQ